MLCYIRANRWAFFFLSESSIILADHRSHIIDQPCISLQILKTWAARWYMVRCHLPWKRIQHPSNLAIQTSVSASKTTNMTTQHWRAARLHLQNGCTYTCCSFCLFLQVPCPRLLPQSAPNFSRRRELIAESSSGPARILLCQGNFRETTAEAS